VDATDAAGEKIHQALMAKKMQRLDESPDFRPFKFRIQAFTNGFVEEASLFRHLLFLILLCCASSLPFGQFFFWVVVIVITGCSDVLSVCFAMWSPSSIFIRLRFPLLLPFILSPLFLDTGKSLEFDLWNAKKNSWQHRVIRMISFR
jgi:hypothetical protein